MKKREMISYLLSFALLLSACVYRIPQETEGSSEPALQESESVPSENSTSAPEEEDATTQPTEESTSAPTESDTAPTYESIEFSLPSETLSSLPTMGENTGTLLTTSCSAGPYSFRYGYFDVGDEQICGWTLVSCSSGVEYAVIPSEVMGVPVVAIGFGQRIFDEHSIKRVVLPETVQYIAHNAFRDCTELADITLPSSIKYIGGWAFENCPGLKELRITPEMTLSYQSLVHATGLRKVIIEEGVTFIPFFTWCSSLAEITLPSTITELGTDGTDGNEPHFYGTQITFVEIPEGVTYLGWYVFQGSDIVSIILPSTLTETSTDTFDTDALKYVFFRGTEDQLLDEVRENIHAPIYFYSETQPTEEGNYWHYVDGEPVIW